MKHTMEVYEQKISMNEIYTMFRDTGLSVNRGSVRYADVHSAYDVRVHFDYNTSTLTTHFFNGLYTSIYEESRRDKKIAFRLGRIDFT